MDIFKPRAGFTKTKILLTACICSVSLSAQAQQLGVVGDLVTVKNSTTTLSTPNISAGGIVDSITNIPVSGPLSFPTFNFTLETSAVAAGTYTFAAGFIIQQQGDGRRLEISIPSVSMAIGAGPTLAGTVAAAQTVSVRGKNSDSSITAVATVSNNVATFDGSNLSFNADNQLSKIVAAGTGSNAILADVINTIDAASGAYSYAVFLKQTGGPGNVKFGHNVGGTFAAYPCNDGSAFTLGTTTLASTFTGASALQGELRFTSSGTVLSGAKIFATGTTCAVFGTTTTTTTTTSITTSTATSFTTTTAATPTTIPTTTPTTATQTEAQIDAALGTLASVDLTSPTVSEGDKTLVASLVKDAGTNAESAATAILSSTTNTAAATASARAALESLSSVFGVSGQLTAGGTAQSTAALTAAISSAAAVLDALSTRTDLTQTQKDAVQASAEALVTNITSNIAATSSSKDAAAIAASLSSVLQGVTRAGGTVTTALAISTQETSNALANSAAEDILKKFFPGKSSSAGAGALTDTDRGRSRLLTGSMSMTVADPAKFVSSSANRELTKDLATSLGVSSSFVFITPVTNNLSRALDTSKTLEELIAGAVGGGASVSLSENDQVNITVDNSLFHTELVGAHIVPTVMPEGASFLADGSVILVSDELSFTVAPAPRDFDAFSAALSSSFSASTSVNQATGTYLLETSDAKASLTFAFEDITPTIGGGTGSVVFGGLDGSPTDAGYKLTITFADGSTQSMLPYVADANYLDSLALAGFLASIDRSTGIITIDNGARFKPDFLVRPLTVSEQTFVNNNSTNDTNGITFIVQADVNGDGLDDVRILSPVGTQVLYTLP